MEQTNMIKRIVEFIEYDALVSNATFAAKAGIDPSGFNKMLKGQLPITKGTVSKIANTYNLRPEWLLNGTEPMYKEKSDAAQHEVSDAFKGVKGNNIGVHNDSEIIKGLLSSLSERDGQINRLLSLLEEKDKQITKLIDKINN